MYCLWRIVEDGCRCGRSPSSHYVCLFKRHKLLADRGTAATINALVSVLLLRQGSKDMEINIEAPSLKQLVKPHASVF